MSHASSKVRSIGHSEAGERRPSLRARIAVLVLGLVSSMALMPSALAATITVGNVGDPATGNTAKCNIASTCTLRDAIASAAAVTHETGDTIVFSLPANSTITLGGSELVVDRNLTIDGSSVSGLAISGNHESGVFRINEYVTATLTHLTIRNGNDNGEYPGGGIYNSGTLILDSSTVSDNTDFGIYNDRGTVRLTNVMVSGSTGTGIYNYGSLTLTNSKIINNIGYTGGIYSAGSSLTLTHSVVSNNTAMVGGGINNDSSLNATLSNCVIARNMGGGITNDGNMTLKRSTVSDNSGLDGITNHGIMMLIDSSVSDNTGGSYSGGIYNGSALTLTNSVVSNNAGERGGGIQNYAGNLTLTNSAISGNMAQMGGGIYNAFGTLALSNTTISGNTATLFGAGLLNDTYGDLKLIHGTLAGNTANGVNNDIQSFRVSTVSLAVANTIVHTCTVDGDDAMILTDNGGNLDGGTGCGFTSSSSKSNAILDLGTLADNGGPTPTMRPGANSDAIGFGLPSVCESEPVNGRDQRGYARSASACTSGAMDPGSPDGPIESNQRGLSGAWADPTTESQGLIVDIGQDFYGTGTGLLFAGWYTFDITAAGGQRWYTLQGQVNGATPASVGIYSTTGGRFDSSQPTATREVGRATLAFHDCTRGTLDYTFTDGSGRRGSIPLKRLLSNETCSPSGDSGDAAITTLLSGAWADTGNSGQGLVFDMSAVDNVVFGGWYTFALDASREGPPGQRWYTLQATFKPGTPTPNGVGIYESTGGAFNEPADTRTARVGTASLVFTTCTSATLQYTFTGGASSGRSGTLDLSRVGAVPSGCGM